MMIGYPMFRIEKLWYGTVKPGKGVPMMHALRIEIANGEVLDVPNGDWSVDNPALQALAYLGVSPSTMDEAEGKFIPVAIDRRGAGEYDYRVPDMVLNNGRAYLEQAEWFAEAASAPEDARQVEIVVPNRNPGGSDDPAA